MGSPNGAARHLHVARESPAVVASTHDTAFLAPPALMREELGS